jgi:hypothetical protein
MLRPHRNHVLSLFLVVAVTIPLAACGGSDKADTTTTTPKTPTTTATAAAATQVCDARSDVKTAADKAIDEVKSGNFGNAATAFKDVSSSVETLLSSVKDLTSAQKEKIQSQVDDLSNELQTLPSSINSKGDLNASMDKLKTDVDSAIDSIGDDLSC